MENFRLLENASDLALIPNPARKPVDHSIYQGRTVLVPHAKLALRNQIDSYFEKQVLGAYFQAHRDVKPTPDFFRDNRQAVIDWCKQAKPELVDENERIPIDCEDY